MPPPRWSSIAFADPGLVSFGRPGGLTLDPTGALATIEGDDAIRQAIFMLLTTRVGERVMRPAYGSLLHRLVFAPNDDTTAGLAIHYVRQAIARWERRVEILDVDAGPDPDGHDRLVIVLRYRVRATQSTSVIELPVALIPDTEVAGRATDTPIAHPTTTEPTTAEADPE
jgi:uncharacterized protein